MAEKCDGVERSGKCAVATEERATKALPPAARRALAEAEERREAAGERAVTLEEERGGRKEGLEPTRYGDWEKKGILSDF